MMIRKNEMTTTTTMSTMTLKLDNWCLLLLLNVILGCTRVRMPAIISLSTLNFTFLLHSLHSAYSTPLHSQWGTDSSVSVCLVCVWCPSSFPFSSLLSRCTIRRFKSTIIIITQRQQWPHNDHHRKWKLVLYVCESNQTTSMLQAQDSSSSSSCSALHCSLLVMIILSHIWLWFWVFYYLLACMICYCMGVLLLLLHLCVCEGHFIPPLPPPPKTVRWFCSARR